VLVLAAPATAVVAAMAPWILVDQMVLVLMALVERMTTEEAQIPACLLELVLHRKLEAKLTEEVGTLLEAVLPEMLVVVANPFLHRVVLELTQ